MSMSIPSTSNGVSTKDSTSTVQSSVPWYLWAVAFASTSVLVGVIWDISWHRTIGRDTFWTAAHLAIYLGGAVAGLSCGWLVLQTTFFGTERNKSGGVTFWGFRGPLGAWVCIWGSIAMITSGPFDDWWHNAYGLDVKILSPPHAVLAAGIGAIQIGAMLMALARQNNARKGDQIFQLLFAYASGVLILNLATLATAYVTLPNDQHGPQFFIVSAVLFPFLLVGIARSSLLRFGATTAASVYMAVTLVMIWVLQLFPAQPMLAPILREVTSMVPPAFPLLLVVPALVVDFIMQQASIQVGWFKNGILAVGAGIAAMLVLGIVQWPFAEFLLSEGARNFFFGADQWGYNRPSGPWQHQFWGSPMTAGLFGWTSLIAGTSAGTGLLFGNWMSRVRR